MENLNIKRKELAIKEAHRQGFCSSHCPENELDDDLGWGFLTGVEWADEHPKEGLISIEKACKWVDINFPTIDGVGSLYKESFIKQFKKAMEE